jgi:hypothetical protein
MSKRHLLSLFFYNDSPASSSFVRYKGTLYQNSHIMSPKNWAVFIQKVCHFYMFSFYKYLVVLKK